MNIEKVKNQNFITLRVSHRNGDVLAELVEAPGHQPYIKVLDTQWAKQRKLGTHNRYFRTKSEAGLFIKKTFV